MGAADGSVQRKRKRQGAAATAPTRKASQARKRQRITAADASTEPAEDERPKKSSKKGDVRWKSVKIPTGFGFDELGGVLDVDEASDVEVVYDENGVMSLKQKEDRLAADDSDSSSSEVDDDDGDESAHFDLAPSEASSSANTVEQGAPWAWRSLDFPAAMSDWTATSSKHLVEPALAVALQSLGFTKPTPIQRATLSAWRSASNSAGGVAAKRAESDDGEWKGCSFDDDGDDDNDDKEQVESDDEAEADAQEGEERERDVVGVAQTGSGKTLAYALPIISYILSTGHHAPVATDATDEVPSKRDLKALVLAPTRELALQVRSAIEGLARVIPRPDGEESASEGSKGKGKNKAPLVSVVGLTGGMSAEKQRRLLARGTDIIVATPGRLWDLVSENDELLTQIKQIKFLVIDEADRMIESGHFAELERILSLTRRPSDDDDEQDDDEEFGDAIRSKADVVEAREDMRTFVYSATMSADLQRNLKKRHRRIKGADKLEDLMARLDFRDPDPRVIDLSPVGNVVDTLQEFKVESLTSDKDAHLYHFLLRYPGRTIVFMSSIDGIRRLHPLLVNLQVNVLPLHSGMQQRARLKNLDRFKSAKNAVLLATDVAARGLDIASVDHVVHYQVPRTADLYVHRSGRTARAGAHGFALVLCAPEEKRMLREVLHALKRTTDLPKLEVEYALVDQLKDRLSLAKQIDQEVHKSQKDAHDKGWLRKAAEEMEIDYDSDEFSDSDSGKKQSKKGSSQRLSALRAELQDALRQPLRMQGLSAKYLTLRGASSGDVDFVDQLVAGNNHPMLMGVIKSTALEDAKKRRH